MKRGKHVALTLSAVLANYLLDRITKWFALARLKGRPPLSLLKGTIVVVFTENRGAFLSLGASWPLALKYLVLLILPIVACALGLAYLLSKERDKHRSVLLGTIIGGGLGNLIDRLFNGFKVIDFLNFGIGNVRTGILNVADLSVTVGALALLLYEGRKRG